MIFQGMFKYLLQARINNCLCQQKVPVVSDDDFCFDCIETTQP